MVYTACRRRIGAFIFALAVLAPHTTLLHAAQKQSAAKKKSAPTKKTVRKATPAQTRKLSASDEIERAGALASENVDRTQSLKMDPSSGETVAEKRVHEWLKAHHSNSDIADSDTDTAPRQTAKPARTAKAAPRTERPAAHTEKPAATAKKEEPTEREIPAQGRKATAADFDAAAARQSKAHELLPGDPRSSLEKPEDPGDDDDSKQVSAHDAKNDLKQLSPARPAAAVKTVALNKPQPEKPQRVASKAVVTKQDDDADDGDPAEAQDDDDAPAATPAILARDGRGRIVDPGPLRGTHEILVHQNVMADREGLDRIRDDRHLERLRASRQLVAIPVNNALRVDSRLPGNRRYARPWTVRFLADMAAAHYKRFGAPLQVNSAVRTIAFQRHLMLVNGNAAPPTGNTASPHLTGQAVDLAKRSMSITELAWMRGYLLPLVQQGKIDVEEEFQQACFHISVYKAYLPERAPKRKIGKRNSTALIAAGIR